jgi:hypothetical protein
MSFRRTFRAGLCVCVAITLSTAALLSQVPAQSFSSSSSSSSKPARKPVSAAGSPLDSGTVRNDVYRNPAFGFACKIPAAWVLRTAEMNAREEEVGAEDHAALDQTAPSAPLRAGDGGRVLLAAFSRPPEAHGEEVNGSIVIAAESVAAYPGLKDAAQYFGPVTEVAKTQGFEVVEEPYEFVIGTKTTGTKTTGTKTMVRGDFQKDVGTRVMWQSTLVVLARGYVVSFTFIGGTEDEVEELVQGLTFGASAKSAR